MHYKIHHTERGNRPLSTLRGRTENALRWSFVGLLALILVPYGAVQSPQLHLLATGFFLLAMVALLMRPIPANTRTACMIAVTVASLLAIWMIIQAIGLDDNPLANPIWTDVEQILGPVKHSISVTPGDTLQGLVAALLPFSVFVSAVVLFAGDRHSLWLIRAIVLTGVALTIFGLFQFVFFPELLLFEQKYFYRNSLTVVFVNANTAATYLAMLLVFAVGLAFHAIQNGGAPDFLRFLIGAPTATRPADARAGIAYIICSAILFVALMLTKSRAGVASGMMGVLVLTIVLAYFGSQQESGRSAGSFSRRRTPRSTKWLRVGLAIMAILAVGVLFSGQAIMRAQVQGSNDVRFCFMPGILEMVRDNWLTGTGFGSFRYAFPAYRDPTCGLDGVLTRAHNFYLEAWITLGLPFVLLASTVLVGLFYNFIRGIRTRRQYRWISAAALGALLIQILHNAIDFSIQIPAVAVVFAALMGAGVISATSRVARSSSGSADTAIEATRRGA